MIKPEKEPNALYALQGVLITARALAYDGVSGEVLARLLDSAEILPSLIAGETDETNTFRNYIAQIAVDHKCGFILQRFDDPVPPRW